MKQLSTYILLILMGVLFSCVEEIDLKTEAGFESALVIEATLTNEFKTQVISLTRAYELGTSGPLVENNAQVRVISDAGESYDFFQSGSGNYLSAQQFAAQPNSVYRLEVQTSNGRLYNSEDTQLTNVSQIDDVSVERDFNEDGLEGVSIYVDSFDPSGNSIYYRYTYEETYKIIAPKYSSQDLIVTSRNPWSFAFQAKPEQQQVCFATDLSNAIIIENTNKFNEDRIEDFRVRFLSRNNTIISHRYSILVRQFIQSSEAHEYYRALRDLSGSDDILSQSQPGFLNGNVFSLSDDDEKVIGFFQVSSVDQRRIYFNYADVFPNENLPPYFQSCPSFSPVDVNAAGDSPLANALDLGNKFFDFNEAPFPDEGSYYLVAPICGNCTLLGNNFPPDFWEE